ncbi:E3 ubiquitin-protein ligase makorin isoform X2 [Cryptomeria japonica]|nr:E3 ubiquitin-protein ligase makorin isoform X2 [Cryptomeria japonica]
MPNRSLCKYFMHGACLKGEHCEFSHDWKDQSNNVCTFYQRGVCSYGSRCRYDHVKVSRPQSILSLSPSSRIGYEAELNRTTIHSGLTLTQNIPVGWNTGDLSALSKPYFPPVGNVWTPGLQDESSTSAIEFATKTLDGDDQPICSFAAAGKCPRGDNCPHVHGDLCATCGKHCLHPYRTVEREEHIKQCQRNQKRLEALRHSQEIECSVCLDRVLTKSTPAERKFGILSECDHPFCISCIRSWRGNTPVPGMDVNSVLRACPICRKLSHFVTPSVIWYSSQEEKQEIINNYKNKLRSIDCRHFDFGNGTCPFGTSCFYKHAHKDGRLEEVKLRHLGTADGSTVIAKNVRLSEFLGELNI